MAEAGIAIARHLALLSSSPPQSPAKFSRSGAGGRIDAGTAAEASGGGGGGGNSADGLAGVPAEGGREGGVWGGEGGAEAKLGPAELNRLGLEVGVAALVENNCAT